MSFYKKEDLLFNDYDWTAKADHVRLKDIPDRNMFMRNEGHDVLYMINYLCTLMNYDSKKDAGKIEILIHEKLPIGVKSQKSVYNWLQNEYVR